jgi:hypothetical protein
MAFFGMTLKFVEVSLGHKYRVIYPDGTVSGGAVRYLSTGLGELGFPKFGKFLALFFAICCIGGSFGGGNMFQANQAFQQIVLATGGENSFFYNKGWLGGIFFALVVGSIIIGGIKSIGKVTEKLVPIMGVIYCLGCLYIIISNISLLPKTIQIIFDSAFSVEASFGGIIGVMIAGIKRAVFSNESGIGSAPIAYAAAKSDNHLNTGFMSLLAAAYAIGAEPIPDSFEKTALLIPAIITPIIPPNEASTEKALSKMICMVFGKSEILLIIIYKQPKQYITPMIGTNFSVTFPIDLIPPIIIEPTTKAKKIPPNHPLL